MILELLFNGFLLLVSIVCFADITAVAPAPRPRNMNAAQWPQMIFGLLALCIVVNMVRIWRAAPKEARGGGDLAKISVRKIVQSKLFIAIVFLFAYVYLLNVIGFILASLVFSVAYIALLGERRPLRVVVAAVVMVSVVYCIFINLEVMLPRGVSLFRDFHLMMESLVRI